MFKLHPQLARDTIVVGDFPLCRLLLMNDLNYPWFILVPRRAGVKEIFEMAKADQLQLLRESSHLSETMQKVFQADKMNVAALGNMVQQLHIHHIARYKTDPAWPKPVWGLHEPIPYSNRALQETCGNLVDHLQDFTPDNNSPVAPRVC